MSVCSNVSATIKRFQLKHIFAQNELQIYLEGMFLQIVHRYVFVIEATPVSNLYSSHQS